jgi:transposase
MRYIEIQKLKQKGFSIAKIAKKLGVSRNTVYKDLEKTPEEFETWVLSLGSRGKKLDTYEELIVNWLREYPDLSGAQIHDWLRERYENFSIGESTVRGYVNEMREKYHIPKSSTTRPYQAVEELPMGKQAQVDFGETIVRRKDGTPVKLWFIAFVLSHSRFKFVHWVDKPFTTREVIRCHEAAFDYYGGMPEELVYDQDHLISVSENAGDIILTKEFQAYQQLRKFHLYLCRKSDPETKGKIENVVKYVKQNFSKNRVFTTLEVWNELSMKWLERTGNYKVNQTTKKRPFEVHALEKQHLQKVSSRFSFENNHGNSITRNIQKDNVVKFESNRYTVPTGTYKRGQSNRAYLEITQEQRLLIRLSPNGEVIGNHPIHKGKGLLVQDQNHKRKRSTKLDTWQIEIGKTFKDKEQIEQFFSILRERYPRHIGDQLSILWNLVQHDSEWIDIALDRAMKLKLNSANDFRDLLFSIKEEEKNRIGEKREKELEDTAYSHITASTREIDYYIEVMKGGKPA